MIKKWGDIINKQNSVLDYANRLEGILRKYLDCGYNDFGVKANDNLTKDNWQKPIIFALGHRYGSSQNDPEVKENIDFFLDNEFYGKSIGDLVERYEYYDFATKDDAFNHIDEIIGHLEKILFP